MKNEKLLFQMVKISHFLNVNEYVELCRNALIEIFHKTLVKIETICYLNFDIYWLN